MRTIRFILLDTEGATGRRATLAVWGRRAYVVGLTIFILLGLLDVFGSRTGVVSAA